MNRNRLLLLVAAAGVAVVVVVLVIVLGGSGGGGGSTSTEAVPAEGGDIPAAVFDGIPQSGDTLGRAGAPTLFVFEDPQCPYCRRFSEDVLPAVVNDFVRAGSVKLVFRGIRIVGPNSRPGLEAIYAAGRQGKLWQMAEELYRRQGAENSGWITTDVIRAAATAAGADADALVGAMPEAGAQLRAAALEADRLGVRGTPSFYLQRPLGTPQQLQITSLDPTSFSNTLSAALQ